MAKVLFSARGYLVITQCSAETRVMPPDGYRVRRVPLLLSRLVSMLTNRAVRIPTSAAETPVAGLFRVGILSAKSAEFPAGPMLDCTEVKSGASAGPRNLRVSH